MKAIILAAGEAKRLRPITEHIPKCMLFVGEKRIIDYQLSNLREAGITEIVFVLGFKAEIIRDHVNENYSNFKFTFLTNPDYSTTNPAYSLWLAKDFLIEGALYLNADVICHPEIIGRIISYPHDSVTALQKTSWEEEEVNIILDLKNHRVLELGKHIQKEQSFGEFIGVTKISTSFASTLISVLEEFITQKELKKFAADALNVTIQRGQKLFALDVSEFPAIEIDTPEDYLKAEQKVASIDSTTTSS
ncbi:MAG: phosphocholine cytidylyltransferase family protein [Candidatus Pacebacteria bacterium]|nr:phosphocholine cytidylyltransferase family protein [Candidatus Paceibacterota bacterium]MBP9842572.1 phosphocholine cytidylyltransferase family protein [Candidatus Paceibacterota bacterium]